MMHWRRERIVHSGVIENHKILYISANSMDLPQIHWFFRKLEAIVELVEMSGQNITFAENDIRHNVC